MEDASVEAPAEEGAATLEENLAALSEPVADDAAEPAPAEEEEFYRIPKSNAYRELQRLADEDQALKNALNSMVGRKAAREYKPKLVELEAELARERAWRISQQKKALEAERDTDPEGFAQKVISDARYRAAWDAKAPDPREVETRGRYQAAIEQTLDTFADTIPPDVLQQFEASVKTGWYDEDRDPASSTRGRKLSPEESLTRLQADLYQFTQRVRQEQSARPAPATKAAPAPAPAPVAEKPKPNIALAQASPDLTPPSSGGSTGRHRWKMSEVKAMSRAEQAVHFPGIGDFGKAVREGLIDTDA